MKASSLSPKADVGILIARVGFALLMFTHGYPKMMLLFSGNTGMFPSVLGMGSTLSLILAVFSEIVCCLLVLVGYKTRLATIPVVITMLVAAFYFHASDPFSGKENALLFLVGFLVLYFTGSGKYSVDYLLEKQPAAAALQTRNQPVMAKHLANQSV